MGTFGFIEVAIFDYGFGELLERKYWLPISVVLTIVGGLIIALAGSSQFWITAIGAIILFIGFNIWYASSKVVSTAIQRIMLKRFEARDGGCKSLLARRVIAYSHVFQGRKARDNQEKQLDDATGTAIQSE